MLQRALIDLDLLRLGLALAGLLHVSRLTLQRQAAPNIWFVVISALLIIVPVAFPSAGITPWRDSYLESGLEKRLDVVITIVCGMAAGIVIARLVAPKLFETFDQKLLARDMATAGVRQWIGTMAIAGAFLGWQAMTSVGLITAVIAIVSSLLVRVWPSDIAWSQWSAWVWLSVLLYTVFHGPVQDKLSELAWITPVSGHVLAALGAYGLASVWGRLQPGNTENRIVDKVA